MKINGEYIDKILLRLKGKSATNQRKLLQLFFRELEYLNITINDELFNIIKYSSKELKGILEKLEIISFDLNTLLDYVNGKYDFYLRLKPYNKNLVEAIKIIDYYLSFFSQDKEEIKRNKDSIEYQKLELIINNYNLIILIHALYKEMFEDYNAYELDKIIVNLSPSKLQRLLENVFLYKNDKINNKFMDELNSIYRETVSINHIFDRFFRKIPGINETEGKKILKKLFFHFDEKVRNNIINYTEHRLSGRTEEGGRAYNNIQTMQKQYKRIIEKGETYTKTLEDYFPLYPGIAINVQNEIMYNLIRTVSIDRKRDIDMYIRGEATARSDIGTRARSTIQILQKQYKREIQKLNGPILTYYDGFKDFDFITEEEKKEIVDYVISLLSSERQIDLKKYILGEIKERSEFGKIAKSDLQTARKRYNKIATHGLLHKTRYDYFPNIKGITIEEKKEVVDMLLRDIGIDRQTNIDRLAEMEINSASIEGKKAYNDISVKKRQYGNYILDVKDLIKNIALIIKEKYGIDLEVDISFAKLNLLYMAVKIIEYVFRVKRKGTKKEFKLYLENEIALIYEENPNLNLEMITIYFIDLAYHNLQDDVLIKL